MKKAQLGYNAEMTTTASVNLKSWQNVFYDVLFPRAEITHEAHDQGWGGNVPTQKWPQLRLLQRKYIVIMGIVIAFLLATDLFLHSFLILFNVVRFCCPRWD